MTTPSTPPVVQRDRASILASALIRELATSRAADIMRESVDSTLPPFRPTPKQRAWQREYKMYRRQARRIERLLGHQQIGIHSDGRLYPFTVDREKRRQAVLAAKQRRYARIKELRTTALIGLLKLSTPEAHEAAVKAFQRKLEAI